MATISTTINVVDKMTSPMRGIISSVQRTIDVLESVDSATNKGFDTSKINAAKAAIDKVNADYEKMKEEINKTSDNQEKLNKKLSEGKSSATSFVKGMMGLSVVQKVLSLITGQIDSAMKRMDTMTNFNRTMTAITKDAGLAKASLEELKATTKGTAYGLDVAASAVQNFTTRGMNIGNATSEVGKWADAVSFYSDGTNESLNTVQDALGKMLSKGKVEMEQLNRLTDSGINAVGIYAQATGRSTADVQDDLSKGKISAMDFITTTSTAFTEGTNGVLKIAGAAKEAGATWATTMANGKAAITRGLIELINGINSGLSNAGFGTILDGIANGGSAIENMLTKTGNLAERTITLLSPVLNLIKNIGSFIVDNWSSIAPIIMGIVTAFGIYNAIIFAYNTIETVSNGIKALSAANSALKAGATLGEAAATTTAAGAQVGLNTAILACPIFWIITAIIALIAIIIAVAARIAKTSTVANNAFSVICGWVNVAIQFFKNFGLEVANVALGIWEVMKACWDNVGTAFHNTKCNLQNDWYSLLSTILNVVSSVCEALNSLPFVEFDYSGLVSKANSYADKAAEAAGSKQDYKSVSDAWSKGYSTYNAFQNDWSKDAYNSGATWGNEKWDKISGLKDKLTSSENLADLASLADTTASNTGNTAKNTSKVADAVTASAEDLKYIRDIAEQEAINRFTTAQITVNMTNNNNVNSDTDVDGITEHLRTKLEEEMNAVAEGVY